MHESHSSTEVRDRLRAIVTQSGRLLDSERFNEFVDLFDKEGIYTLEAHSTEIGRDMTWLSLDQRGLKSLFEEWPRHVHDESSRKHLITVDDVQLEDGVAAVLSTFVVFRTDESGRTELYCVGSYEDRFSGKGMDWKLSARKVRLDTRLLSTPTPIPL
jgi:3-phenylpropionate/cinnamic acid dioxygenase small subunit